MKTQDYTTSFLVDRSPVQVFEAIGNVRGWWSENIEGCTDKAGCEFFYHYRDIHRCRIRVVEALPGQRVIWHVEDNFFKFTRDKSEWKGTTIRFEVSGTAGGTTLVFTHEGLTTHYECYEVCRDAWTHFIRESLRSLIETGKGEPSPKDGSESFDAELVKERGLDSEDLVLSFGVDRTPEQVFDAITDVRGWWGRGVEGDSRKEGDEFVYRHGEVHYSRHRLSEVVPGKKIVWLTTDSRLNFVASSDEWTGTTISFDIIDGEGGGASVGDQGKTTVRFTHAGLTPVLECYGGCSGAWAFYIGESLRKLIETGEGTPDPK
jgi:uncharacterized protein YndB with AHSA1/START domain